MNRVLLVMLCVVAAIGQQPLSGSSQRSGQQDQSVPTFRGAVELVQVDVFVTDEDGEPVRGLTADDFEVFERGKLQAITTFAAVDLPRSPGIPVASVVESDVLTNDTTDSRAYLFVLDDGVLGPNALRARAFMRRFLDEHFREKDIAAVLVGKGLATDGQDFTQNRRLLLAAIDKFQGDSTISFLDTPGRLYPTSSVMGDIRDLRERVEFFARMPAQRKAVLWITERVIFDSYQVVDYQGGVLSQLDEEAHRIVSAATRGNIRIYVINPSALDPEAIGTDHVQQRANFNALAAVTGGFALIDSNNFSGAFERMIDETSTYYVLGYELSVPPRPGRYTEFDVRVKRSGLRVKARPGYAEELDYLARQRKPEPPHPPVAVALGRPVAVSGLPMRVVATPYRKSGNTSAVALTVDLAASGLAFVRDRDRYSARIDFRHLATDVRNRVQPEFRHTATVTLSVAEYERAREGVVRVVSEFELPSGRYQLRVASASGSHSGNVVYDLDVPDFRKEALQVSGITLTDTAASGVLTVYADASGRASNGKECRPPTCTGEVRAQKAMQRWPASSAPAAVWQGSLASPPTTSRSFDPDETVSAFFEVYDNRARGASDSNDIDVTLTLRTMSGDIIRTSSSEPGSSSRERRASGGRGFVRSLPLKGVDAGRYVVQVEARSRRNPARVASRRIPLSVN
jgi:VWFA-related protein